MTPLAQQTRDLSLNENEAEYIPTPQVNHKLHCLNRNIAVLSEGRVSPVRFQLQQDIDQVSQSTQRYIKRKAQEVVETSLECIAPSQSEKLLNLITAPSKTVDKTTNKAMDTLISLYNKATSNQTKLTLLSIFVQHFTKTQLKEIIPGLTTWRIDKARKYAYDEELPCENEASAIRYRLDEKKVDHFIEFISSPIFLQDVAYGTRKLRLSSGEVIEIPNMVRTVVNGRMVKLYESYCKDIEFKPLGRSSLLAILKVYITQRDVHILPETQVVFRSN